MPRSSSATAVPPQLIGITQITSERTLSPPLASQMRRCHVVTGIGTVVK